MRLGRMHPSQQTFTDCSSLNFLEFPALSIAMTCVMTKREEKASQNRKSTTELPKCDDVDRGK